ncbi:MAG: ABC transporter permease [Planctomycetota bacterium]
MKFIDRLLLPILGILAFIILWSGIVIATAPPPRLRPAFGFSASADGIVNVVVIDEITKIAVEDTISLADNKKLEAVEKLRVMLGAHAPTLAAIPPTTDKTAALRDILEAAKTEFGGGLEVKEIATDPSVAPNLEAFNRAKDYQKQRMTLETWLPLPQDAFVALVEMTKSGEMVRHIIASIFRVFSGFIIAALLGIPFGLALGSFARINSLTNSIIQIIRPISPIAWLPVANMLFKGSDSAAIFLIFLCSFFPITVSTAAAIATVDLKYRRSAMNFGVTGISFARYVLIPAALPSILTALRVAVGISWVVIVAAEMLGVEQGLGYQVLDARIQLRYDKVVAAMIVIGFIGLLIDLIIRKFELSELERRGLIKL